ncbi:hypothetical protein J7384_17715 [Endozoicomonas sp. G2_1]|uniref:hypothetical protein n=1 Tax=Endozoicomonas sp. G2_1 TaxID=2821091 RepID=UPI001ADB56C3|nr:hypothetical protein [Endozoicomonas sp. G2_1]MBO9492203.1 hypothetical protein [Endozoicomonas sp. G2_1]
MSRNAKQIMDNMPMDTIAVVDTDNYRLPVTHFSESLNSYMVRDKESGQWFSYDEEMGFLYDELPQEDMRLLSDIEKLVELQGLTDMAAKFVDDVMPQVGKICIQDFANLNELCMAISANRI